MASDTKIVKKGQAWTASELRALPPEERDDVLTSVAEEAARDYASPALNVFEAFGPEDLFVC